MLELSQQEVFTVLTGHPVARHEIQGAGARASNCHVDPARGVPNLELRDKALKLGGVDVIITIMGSNAH